MQAVHHTLPVRVRADCPALNVVGGHSSLTFVSLPLTKPVPRSKLKCDRVFPCQSCIRRGCAEICPEGTLAATKGNKVLMAHAQRLTEQVKALTERVHELELALEHAQTEAEKTGMRIPEGQIGSASHYRLMFQSATNEHSENYSPRFQDSLEFLRNLLSPFEGDADKFNLKQLDLPPEIVDLVNAFPFGLKECQSAKTIFLPYFPTKERAEELANAYYHDIAWLHDPVIQDDFFDHILGPIYGSPGPVDLHQVHPHCLSIFFTVLANGVAFGSYSSSVLISRRYYAMARAAFSLQNPFHEASCVTIQALFMIIRLMYTIDLAGYEERWILSGLCARLSQVFGLQREETTSNINPNEIQRRRRIFWELITWELWTSLVSGRPPALLTQHTTCPMPDEHIPHDSGSSLCNRGWHEWKYKYTASCLSLSVTNLSSGTAPYPVILDIDKAIRAFPDPDILNTTPERASGGEHLSLQYFPNAMQQYSAVCFKEGNLLHLHRAHFIQAVKERSDDPLQHTYGASVMAIFHSARRLSTGLRSLYSVYPRNSAQCWFFWANMYSACLVLGTLIVESPTCSLAEASLRELEVGAKLYDEASRPCRPPETVSILQKLVERASQAYAAAKNVISNTSLSQASSSQAQRSQSLGRRGFSTITSDLGSATHPQDNSRPVHVMNSSEHNTGDRVVELVTGGSQDWGQTAQGFAGKPLAQSHPSLMSVKKGHQPLISERTLGHNSLHSYLPNPVQPSAPDSSDEREPGQMPRRGSFESNYQWHPHTTLRHSTVPNSESSLDGDNYADATVVVAPQAPTGEYNPEQVTDQEVWGGMMDGFTSV
ncbi:hypothetical protein AX16_010417 [Volvariella volvacea WC 439]|nr:hypothetical protein AX16_010417 [Volvariella volvacea WC 439]